MSVASYRSQQRSGAGVISSLYAIFQLMRERRMFIALSFCEVVRGFIKVPSYALGLKWLTDGCLQRNRELLLTGLSLLVGAVVVVTLIVTLTEYCSLRITAKTKAEIRARLIEASLSSDLGHADLESPDLLYTLNDSVNDLGQLYRATDAFIGTFGKVFGTLVTGFWLSPSLSLLVLTMGLGKVCLDRFILKPLQGVVLRIKRTEAGLIKEVMEHLDGTVFFRVFGNEARSVEQFAEIEQRYTAAQMDEARISALGSAARKGVEFLTMLAVLGMGGLAVVRGDLAMGSLAAFISIYDDLINPFRRIGEFLKDYQSLSLSYDRIDAVMSAEKMVSMSTQGAIKAIPAGTPFSLIAEGISFAYNDGQPVLRDVSFEAPSGAITYIIGRSGAGKSTLFKIMMGLCTPDQGRVGLIIDGQGLTDPTPEFFNYVSQDPFLFTGSIRENIVLADGAVDEARLVEAIEKAGISDLIEELPDGLETMLRDGGKQLSGGQRCRIALARAFYRDTPIILLDEAYASLDNNNIELIKRSISQLCSEGRCVVMISHRHEWIDAGARVVEISRDFAG
ncbi:MAG: ABC transporter ATP-binding protein [Bacillota bacterium]